MFTLPQTALKFNNSSPFYKTHSCIQSKGYLWIKRIFLVQQNVNGISICFMFEFQGGVFLINASLLFLSITPQKSKELCLPNPHPQEGQQLYSQTSTPQKSIWLRCSDTYSSFHGLCSLTSHLVFSFSSFMNSQTTLQPPKPITAAHHSDFKSTLCPKQLG